MNLSVTAKFLRKFPETDGIYFAIEQSLAHNILEDDDYDARHGVDMKNSAALANLYLQIAGLTAENSCDVLEVGCGSGMLTVGLSTHSALRHAVATDLSALFLAETKRRVAALGRPDRVTFVCGDLNEPMFKSGAFDLIVGNSLLHHIYDYESFLLSLRGCLRDGGRIIFNEPCQRGKSTVSFLLSVMVALDATRENPVFAPEELYLIKAVQTIHRRELVALVNPEIKMNWEDKHMFDTDKLALVAKKLGFSGFETQNTAEIRDGFKSMVKSILQIMRITKPLDSFDDVFKAYQEEFVVPNPLAVQTPHQFVSFIK